MNSYYGAHHTLGEVYVAMGAAQRHPHSGKGDYMLDFVLWHTQGGEALKSLSCETYPQNLHEVLHPTVITLITAYVLINYAKFGAGQRAHFPAKLSHAIRTWNREHGIVRRIRRVVPLLPYPIYDMDWMLAHATGRAPLYRLRDTTGDILEFSLVRTVMVQRVAGVAPSMEPGLVPPGHPGAVGTAPRYASWATMTQ